MIELALTKESSSSQIKAYFEKVLELYKSHEQFPINLDDVWMLVYAEKGKAVRALRKGFVEGEDFNLSQNGKVIDSSRILNGVEVTYHLSVSCLEYFIAKKVRHVFEVYRSVFHKVATGDVQVLPKDYATALRELANQVELNERLAIENKMQQETIAEQTPKVVFTDAVIGSKSSCLIGELAKILTQNGFKIGQNRLFEVLRRKHFLGSHGEYYNIPNQRYVEQGLFELRKSTHSRNGVMHTTETPLITGKGQVYFVNYFLKGEVNIFGFEPILPEQD